MKRAPFLLVLCLLLLLPLPCRASSGLLRVSFNSFPPWKTMDEKGVPGGIDVEFLRLLAQRMDLEIRFIQLPFKRGLKLLEYGEVDLMTGVLRRTDREDYAHFLAPAYKTRTNKAFYVLKGREDTITRYEDLHGMVIGTQLGGKYFPRFDADKAIVKSVVKDTEINAKMLLAGRIDAFITTETPGDYRLARLGLTDAIGKARYIYAEEQPVHMILSKRSPLAARLDEFNRVMRELVESGEFERIKKVFLSTEAP